ncbi:hypothetical protein C8R44DRAFT_883751 [Mycena epipterygia]|nr:hypothetical protein C8R44DRAFT_883751 [Mycena epipterygia]
MLWFGKEFNFEARALRLMRLPTELHQVDAGDAEWVKRQLQAVSTTSTSPLNYPTICFPTSLPSPSSLPYASAAPAHSLAQVTILLPLLPPADGFIYNRESHSPATLGIGAGSTSCECPTQNTAFGIAIPAALMGSNMCCNVQVQLAFGERTSAAVLDAIYDTGAGTENIALSPAAFAALSPGFINQTSLSPVTWSFF